MHEPVFRFRAALRLLSERHIQFVVVGGIGALLHGAPLMTFDLDIVAAQTSENLDLLHAALIELDATYREHPNKQIRPRRPDLALPGHHLLMTRYGSLDVRGAIGRGLTYTTLVERSETFDVEPGLRVRVLNLDALIELKEAANREKDRAVLPVLRRTLEEQRRRAPPGLG